MNHTGSQWQNADPALTAPDTVMPEAPLKAGPRPRRRRARAGLWLLVSLVFIAGLGLFGAMALSGKPIRLPVWMVAEAETRLNHALPLGQNALSLGGIEVTVGQDWVPRLRLEDLRLSRRSGGTLLTLPDLRVSFDAEALFQGHLRPAHVTLSGARMRLRRDMAGRFDLDLGADMGAADLGSFAEVLDRIDRLFAQPELAELKTLTAEALSLTLEDARARRVWEVGDGRLSLQNGAEELALELGLTLASAGQAPARAVLSAGTRKGSAEARLRVVVEGVAARDIAAQAPPLAFLSVLDAPISGRLSAAFDASGAITSLEGALDLASGALHPNAESQPIAFERANIALAYDPAAEKIRLSEVKVESASLRLSARGQIHTPGVTTGLPDAFMGQIEFAQVMVDPEGLFTEPVTFSQGALDMRLRLDPFRIDLGQLVLVEDGRRLQASGHASADERGWTLSLDLGLDAITHDRLLALWPVSVVAKTRAWLVENVQEGLLYDVKAALRLAPEQEPRLSLGYEFADTDVRFLKTLPPIRRGHGYATIEGNSYTMVLDRGEVTPAKGGAIDMSGSVFSVLDILQRPAQAEINLKTSSSVTAALSLLDEEPFHFLTKAGRPVELAEGRADLRAVMRLPLVKKVLIDDVSYRVEGVLSDVTSDVIVPGKVISAPRLMLAAEPSGLTISGAGAIGAVPFDVTYQQDLRRPTENVAAEPGAAPAQGQARVTGTAELSPRTVAEFDLGLPQDMLNGTGQAQIDIALTKDEPPHLNLTSDLRGLVLSLPDVGWRKPAATAGKLALEARLGSPATVERLSIEAPGLSAQGSLAMRPEGGLDRAEFGRFRVGDWLEAGVTVTGQGKGRAVKVSLTGGRLDLRKMDTGSAEGGSGKSGGSALDVRLDRVQVSDGIALTGFRGQFSPVGGFNGTFSASVNDAAPVRGTVVPTKQGSAVRVTSADAGAVLAASGVFANARGGDLDLQLTPTGVKGHYNGIATGRNFRVRNAPVLAELLSAVSIVGILEQLNGTGLVFNEADARFRLTPGGIEVTRSAAIGASMGVSMAGTYDSGSKRLNMQGVISPIYLLNGIGSILTRRGEGLFGFNYTISGTSDQPQISVNPLSILTPGMFREIFRRPVPTLGGNG